MMNCNVEGLLKRAAYALDRDDDPYGRAFALRELAKNLRELQRAVKAGDLKAAERFFELYVFDE